MKFKKLIFKQVKEHLTLSKKGGKGENILDIQKIKNNMVEVTTGIMVIMPNTNNGLKQSVSDQKKVQDQQL